jgi:threonine/homoserine/homoserine lactone efflux protein
MFGIHNYTDFVAAVAVFQLIPGPGTLTILNATARRGLRSGLAAVAGTLAGDLLFMLAAVCGLAAVLAARPAILSSLQWVGITYLCWLGLKLLFKPAPREGAEQGRTRTYWASFRQGFTVCLTNPKAIMFFMAFFPLFLAPDSPPTTLALMIVHVSLISLLYQVALVFVGNSVAVRFARVQRARVLARRVLGLGLIGFGIKLAVNRR